MDKNKFKMSAAFNVEDIHNLRVYLGNKYRSMPKKEVEKDIAMHYQEAKTAIENIRKKAAKKAAKQKKPLGKDQQQGSLRRMSFCS